MDGKRFESRHVNYFCLVHNVKTGPWAHPANHAMLETFVQEVDDS
jgi:hypothetical protein